MHKILLLWCFLLTVNTFARGTVDVIQPIRDLVPVGYVVVEKLQGDLTKDNQDEIVLMIKGTDANKVIQDEYRGELDRNRRGIIIVSKNNDEYELLLKNLDAFSSENEDGGVYFAPELNMSIKKGNLYISYSHGRYGYWVYNFRYQNSDFELIGYDSSQDRGPVVERFVSINFMTKKMLIKENINQFAESGDEVFNETWKRFSIPKRLKLSEISDFDELYIEGLLTIIE